ncbi:bifunctional protein-serine/threonine kinase/phosphatase [Massilia sp. TW-1]|uniref:Bifunctional protein-serine/threonine kinase/phosphatase n=1 Tax=Telluria antibiotica TaxID=2717319 RepID=A0ABX0P5N4_9BURK|nr:bifunctional protein-serine/threonine kinase/phosphatase [Telluria antibiotica]NIA52157.1 bifunctional protein-serine/threonine kinase/phosphatase [Telluria antibiotica]
MSTPLTLSVGQHTDRGRKPSNQDCHGAALPRESLRATKGAALALADGIGSSDVSHVASATAVASFLEDYYATSDAWSVRTSAERVLAAVNAWLYAQTRQSQDRYDQDRGYVCTFTALVIKSNTAHVFHVGDARLYRVHMGAQGASLEQVTTDHRVWVSPERSYLSRALGVQDRIDIDYRSVALDAGDLFMLATDGVYEHVTGADVHAALEDAPDLDAAACRLVERALENGSPDNLTVQFVRIESLQAREASELLRQMAGLPLPPQLEPRAELDGYRIVREVHGSSRSHVYLALDPDSGAHVILKTPSTDLAGDGAHMERFVMEEWVMGRVRSPHVVRPAPARRRSCVYVATEYIDGVTLAQWLRDRPRPGLDAVRRIVDQVAKGLRAFHRLDMLHQDVRPENVMIDGDGNARIIDFGSVSVAGVVEMAPHAEDWTLQGAALYAAPEYFLGEHGTVRSDVFALGVLTYLMLTGELPYGVEIPRAAQRKLVYRSARDHDPGIPAWVDAALRKALQIDPRRRYEDVSEFVYDLHHPNGAFLEQRRTPLIERSPLLFWKAMSFTLVLALVADLALRR